MPVVWIEVFFFSDICWIHTSHIFGACHVAQDSLGAQHQCLHVSSCSGRPGCQLLRYSASRHRGMLSPAPAALPQLAQNFLSKYSCWSIWEKIHCVLSIQQQPRQGVWCHWICFVTMVVGLWPWQGSQFIFSRTSTSTSFHWEDAMLLLFVFFLQVQELFVLLGTTAVLCCLTEVSKIIIFLLLRFLLAWIGPFFLLIFWYHLSNLS